MNKQDTEHKVRLDKWLWAARFFKTRAIAKNAIEGGKVHYEGQRSKVSKIVEVGAKITLRQGHDEKTVTIDAISDQRRGAPEAQKLYTETVESIKKRMDASETRRAMKGTHFIPDHKPNKRERRQLSKFREQNDL